jgi:hypothetical protein
MMLGGFGFVRIRLGLVDGFIEVVGRGIQSVQFQLGCFGTINDIMIGTGRDDHGFAILDRMFFLTVVQDKARLTFLETEKLVDLLMDLVTDLLARLQAHQYELSIFSGEKNLPEIIVGQSLGFDRTDVSSHYFPPENT